MYTESGTWLPSPWKCSNVQEWQLHSKCRGRDRFTLMCNHIHWMPSSPCVSNQQHNNGTPGPSLFSVAAQSVTPGGSGHSGGRMTYVSGNPIKIRFFYSWDSCTPRIETIKKMISNTNVLASSIHPRKCGLVWPPSVMWPLKKEVFSDVCLVH